MKTSTTWMWLIRGLELAVAFIFLSAAVQKAVGVEAFRTILSIQIPLIDRWSVWSIIISMAIVAIEAAIAVALFCRFEVRNVSFVAIVLLLAFSIVLWTLIFRDLATVPCGCGTAIDLSPPLGIVRNAVLILIFGLLAWKNSKARP